MAHEYHTTFRMEYQGFVCENSEKYENNRRILEFRSKRTAEAPGTFTDVPCHALADAPEVFSNRPIAEPLVRIGLS